MTQTNREKAKAAIKFGTSQRDIPLLILLMGLPGTGKSHVAAYLHEKYGLSIISGENVTHAIFGTEKCTAEQYAEAYQIVDYYTEQLISQGYDVVIDATNGRLAHRQQIYNAVREQKCHPFVIQLVTDDATALARVSQRGVDKNDIQNIKSDISEETYASFKQHVELPQNGEESYQIISGDELFSSVDELILEVKQARS